MNTQIRPFTATLAEYNAIAAIHNAAWQATGPSGETCYIPTAPKANLAQSEARGRYIPGMGENNVANRESYRPFPECSR